MTSSSTACGAGWRAAASSSTTSHVRRLQRPQAARSAPKQTGRELATASAQNKAIMGVFDEGCMGMYNAIIPDELLHPTGVFKERLSQSALYAAMQRVSDGEAQAVRDWLDRKGMRFNTGHEPETELTDAQILDQCKMYIAALRIADEFGCDTIGIQYQQGLKDLAPASDLAEGLLNNVDRPPVQRSTARVLYEGNALPHFNEVDECAGLDGLITNRVWRKLGFAPENTLHDVRYGEEYNGEFVWVFEISGAAPPEHFIGGYSRRGQRAAAADVLSRGRRVAQGISKPGEIVWSRIYIEDNTSEGRPGTRQGGRAAARRDGAPLADDHAAMADHARGNLRRHRATR